MKRKTGPFSFLPSRLAQTSAMLLLFISLTAPAQAQMPATPPAADDGPLHLEITRGVIKPTEFAIAAFHDEGGAGELAEEIRKTVAGDLTGTGLFQEIPIEAHVDDRASFDQPVRWQSWRAINAEALVTGAVSVQGDRLVLKFRLYDVVSGQPLGDGMRFDAAPTDWRRIAHKAADQVYSRMTGEGPYFDSRITFIAEEGPPSARVKRLSIMDYDGANRSALTDGKDLALGPRLSPDGQTIAYTSFANGMPRIALLTLANGRSQIIQSAQGTMSFAPTWSPDGRWIVYTQEQAGNTNLWLMDAASGASRALTNGPAIDTSPSFSPDGKKLVFESDRSGSPQLYVMPLQATQQGTSLPRPERISFGGGSYGTPAWSPRGDLIAFTKRITQNGRVQSGSRLGVMRIDGKGERILTHSYLDEAPSWSPNGRVIVFTRQERDETAATGLYSIDVSARDLTTVRLLEDASDPDWGPLRP